MLLTKVDRTNRFISQFSTTTGFYVRTGVLDIKGKDTGIDPFMAEYPELLDIGVMGHCKNARQCTVGCYQGKISRPNMSLDFFKSIIDQSKGKTFQCALGGFGSPNEHEDFEAIVRYAHENNIVPSYTTSGIELTDEQIEATKKYCGAVAVSWYNQKYTYGAIDRFVESGVKTNIHYVLGRDSIEEALNRLTIGGFPSGINAIIFLLYKPVGCVKNNNVLQYSDPQVQEFFRLIDTEKFSFKVGLDACCVPGLLNFTEKISLDSATPCDGGSFSGYITPDGFMLPCSFDSMERRYAVDLKTHTIQQAWNSPEFEAFRNYHRHSCPACPQQNECRGGCAIRNEINLCERKEKSYEN